MWPRRVKTTMAAAFSSSASSTALFTSFCRGDVSSAAWW